MNSLTEVYIGLGSNQGQKDVLLQSAVEAIFKNIGFIIKISDIYKTPSLGFNGNTFFNTCIKIKTSLSAQSVLEELLKIETKMGRIRKKKGYENRNIDLDILLYGDDIINEENLKIPHPELHKRNFVLYPLADIAAQQKHPILNKSIYELKDALGKQKNILKTQIKLSPISLLKPKVNYLCIEGNIGAGKTTFAQMLSQEMEAKLILERFKENPFLPQFYKDPKRYAFPTEMSFLADRHQQLVDDISQLDLFSQFSIADYDLYKSLIFARITLPQQEFDLYKKVFKIIYRDIPKPDLYIYFYQNTEQLLNNIKKRGRPYEQNIEANYLDKINQGYLDFIKYENRFKTKIIDVSNLDFVNNRKHFLKIARQIFAE